MYLIWVDIRRVGEGRERAEVEDASADEYRKGRQQQRNGDPVEWDAVVVEFESGVCLDEFGIGAPLAYYECADEHEEDVGYCQA